MSGQKSRSWPRAGVSWPNEIATGNGMQLAQWQANYSIAQATNLSWTPTRRQRSTVGKGRSKIGGPPADLAEGKLHPRSGTDRGKPGEKDLWHGPKDNASQIVQLISSLNRPGPRCSRLVPTYLLPAKKEDFWESFSPIALKLTD